jgi:hypothetical protein
MFNTVSTIVMRYWISAKKIIFCNLTKQKNNTDFAEPYVYWNSLCIKMILLSSIALLINVQEELFQPWVVHQDRLRY